jgi:hypothetical protein
VINIRPRPRPPERRHPRRRLALRGHQHTSGTLRLSVVSGDLTLGGAQRTTGSACLTALLGTQRTTGALLPDIILPGRQRTTGLLTFDRPANTFSNGYLYMMRVAAGPQPDLAPATLTDFPAQLDTARVDADWTWLKSTSGKLLSVSGGVLRDVRLELEDGTKLDHYTVLWDGSAGRAVWRFRLPSWLTTGRLVVCVYYGKAGLSSSEENIAGTFRACMAARHPLTGVDLSGNGRHLTMSGVTSALVNGLPGGAYGVNAFGRLANPAYLDGLGGLGLSVELPINVGSPLPASGAVYRVGGSTAGTGDWVLWQDGDAGGAWWSGGWGISSGQNYARSSDPGTAAPGLVLLGLEVQSGQDPALYLTGERKDTRVNNGSVLTGTTGVTAGDAEAVGAPGGSISNPTALPGVYGLLLTYPRKLGPTWWACMARCQMDPASFWGAGSEDAPADADRSPVALPVRATITDAGDIDAVAAAYDPDGGGGLSLVSPLPGQPSHGTASILSGKVHYQRAGTYTGPDQGPFAVKDAAGKVGRARYSLTVLGGTPPSGELPWTTPPGALRRVPKDHATIQAAVNVAQPGDEVSVADGTYAGWNSARAGASHARPVLVRARTDPRPGGTLGVKISSTINLNHAFNQVFGVDLLAGGDVNLNAASCTLTRYRQAKNGPQVGVSAKSCRVGYGEMMGRTDGSVTSEFFVPAAQFSSLVAVYYHDIVSSGNAGEAWRAGRNPMDDLPRLAPGMGCLIRRIRLENIAYNGNDEVLSLKSSGHTLELIHLTNVGHGGGSSTVNVQVRHGQINVFNGILTEGPNTGITVRGYGNQLLGCEMRDGGKLVVKGGAINTATWNAQLAAGTANGNGGKIIGDTTTIVAPKGPLGFNSGGGSLLDVNTVIRGSQNATGILSRWTVNDALPLPAYIAPRRLDTTTDVGVMATFEAWRN